eukprot:CAMPEP_0184516124 /NCGR_PEP_ID=MMETSP0198_2-20121128/4861_1 /TAXON_ID=1112570 /ORGANISM="Thraustochytrium sp., Strain LLF1b" /LENGTH=286 /DNA_ID=CAMNT_0026906423 /DNA_START=124 /DNA_END=984 /DNA_ORIENTATION=-
MRVAELREQLRSLGLNTTGRKLELEKRLNDALNNAEGRFQSHSQGCKRLRMEEGMEGLDLDGGVKQQPKKKGKLDRVNEELLESTFNRFQDPNHSYLGPDGVTRLCEELGVDAEDPVTIVLSYRMQAKELGIFTKEEFFRGMKDLNCNTVQDLTQKLPLMREQLNPRHPTFLDIYTFAYGWACEPNQRSLSKETAINLWRILLEPLQFNLLPDFLNFVKTCDRKGVSKDLWVQTYHFIVSLQTSKCTLENYNSTSDAWPVLIDEWIESMLERGTSQDTHMFTDSSG